MISIIHLEEEPGQGGAPGAQAREGSDEPASGETPGGGESAGSSGGHVQAGVLHLTSSGIKASPVEIAYATLIEAYNTAKHLMASLAHLNSTDLITGLGTVADGCRSQMMLILADKYMLPSNPPGHGGDGPGSPGFSNGGKGNNDSSSAISFEAASGNFTFSKVVGAAQHLVES